MALMTLTPSQIRNILRLVAVEIAAQDAYAAAPSTEARETWTDAADVLLAYCEHVAIDSEMADEIHHRRTWSIDAIIAFAQDNA